MSTHLVVRVHGLSTRLLTPQFYHSILLAPDLKSFVDTLFRTDYRDTLEKIKSERMNVYSSDAIREAIREKFRMRMNLLISLMMEKDVAEVFIDYLRRYEILDLLKVAGYLISGRKPPLNDLFLFTFFDSNFKQKVEKIRSLKDLIDYLLTHKIYSRTLKDLSSLVLEFQNLFILEMSLKKDYYEHLMSTLGAKEIPGINRLERVIKAEIDLENCFITTASYVYGYDANLLEQLLIRHPLKLSLPNLKQAIRSTTLIALFNALYPYRNIVELVTKKKETEAKKEALKILKREISRLKIPGIDIGYILYYIRACEWEKTDLETLLYGILYRASPEEMKAQLITFL